MKPKSKLIFRSFLFLVISIFLFILVAIFKSESVVAAGAWGSLDAFQVNTSGNQVSGPVTAGSTVLLKLRICNTTLDQHYAQIDASLVGSGGSISPISGTYLVSGISCRDINYEVIAPSESDNNCNGDGRNNFVVSFVSSDGNFGRDDLSITLYGSIRVSFYNNTSSTVRATVTSTNFGGLVGHAATVDPGATGFLGGFAVNCAIIPFPSATVSVVRTNDGSSIGVFSNSTSNKNGCRFDLIITTGSVAPPPSPTSGVLPYNPPSNLSVSSGCIGAALGVTFRWDLGTNTNLWLDVDSNNNFNDGFNDADGPWNINVGSATSFGWNLNSTLSGGKAPEYGTRYYWRLWDGTQHTNGSSFVTDTCAQPDLTTSLNCPATVQENTNFTCSGGVNNVGAFPTGSSFFIIWARGTSTLPPELHGALAANTNESQHHLQSFNLPAGSYTIRFCADQNSLTIGSGVIAEVREDNNCSAVTVTVQSGIPPQNLQVSKPSCSNTTYSVTLSWTNSGNNWFVDISTRSDFATFSNKNVSNVTSTSAPSGFSPAITLNPNTAYYWRIFNGATHTSGPSWNVPTCVLPINLTATTDCTNGRDAIVHLSWTSATADSGFNIVRDGVWITITNIKSWDSTPEAQGQSHTWNVLGAQTGTLSNSRTITTATCASPTTDRPSPCPPKGDLNGDGVINSKDADLFGSFFSQTSQFHLDRADLDGNGAINITDAGLLVQYINGSINTFPACTSVPPPPSPPRPPPPTTTDISLTVTSNCLDGVNAIVHLRWTVITDDTQFNLIKNGNHFTSIIGTSWDSGPEVQGQTNSWNVLGLQSSTLSNTVTHTTATCGLGTPSPMPLPDLTVQSISFDKDPFPTYQANETVIVNVVIENIGPVNATNVNVRFFADLASAPDCSTASITAQTTLASVDGDNGQAPWGPFTFSAPVIVGAKQAWALVGCGTTQARTDNDTRSKTYNVSEVGAWFETTGGDVGSRGQIKVGQIPPANRYQSSYILAASSVDPNVKTERWRLSPYGKKLIPEGRVYDYFASRFLLKAQQNPCNITSDSSGLRYCSGNQTIGGLNLTGVNAVWFIIGDLVVNGDVTIDLGSTAVFLVSGNIFINTNVNRADGVYITGGTFNDADSADASGRQLVINGAVYAQSVSLARVLGGSTCSSGPECDNAQTPALVINFAPKYLMQMTSLLGSPSFLWKEVEP